MNDELRERLSAYLDGSLPEAERRVVEAQLERSADLRRELADLRAVSEAVKGLPREKLPAGFMARLQARRAREASGPAREWALLPPAYRPVAAALCAGIVAIVLWDRSIPKPAESLSMVAYSDSQPVPVKRAEEVAPAQVDLSRQVAGGGAPSLAPASAFEIAEQKPAEAFGAGAAAGEAPKVAARSRAVAPGRPLEGAANEIKLGALAAPASPAPEPFSEEKRSAENERLQGELEKEKARMGIVKILDKNEDEEAARSAYDSAAAQSMRRAMAAYSPKPAAAVSGTRAGVLGSVGAMRGAAAKKAAAEAPAGIVIASAEALGAAWAAAGLPGNPPAVDFPRESAAFLVQPATTVVGLSQRGKTLLVLYASVPGAMPSSRVRAIPPGQAVEFVAVPPPANP